METFCKSWPAACWPPVTFSCASRKSFPRQHVKSTHHHGGDDDDDGDDDDGDDQYDLPMMIFVTNSRPLKVLQTSRLLSPLLGKADHANHPHLSSAISQIFCVNQKKVGDTKWGEQSRKSELVPVNRISLTTQQPHFRRTLNPRDKNQVVWLINCFLRLKEGTDCIKENDLFEMFFGGLWLWGHWLRLRD